MAVLTQDGWQEGEQGQGSWTSTAWLRRAAGTQNYTSAASET